MNTPYNYLFYLFWLLQASTDKYASSKYEQLLMLRMYNMSKSSHCQGFVNISPCFEEDTTKFR